MAWPAFLAAIFGGGGAAAGGIGAGAASGVAGTAGSVAGTAAPAAAGVAGAAGPTAGTASGVAGSAGGGGGFGSMFQSLMGSGKQGSEAGQPKEEESGGIGGLLKGITGKGEEGGAAGAQPTHATPPPLEMPATPAPVGPQPSTAPNLGMNFHNNQAYLDNLMSGPSAPPGPMPGVPPEYASVMGDTDFPAAGGDQSGAGGFDMGSMMSSDMGQALMGKAMSGQGLTDKDMSTPQQVGGGMTDMQKLMALSAMGQNRNPSRRGTGPIQENMYIRSLMGG